VQRFLALSLAILLPVLTEDADSSPDPIARVASVLPRAPTGRVRILVTDPSGRSLEARVRFEGRWLTRTPDLGPTHDARGAADTVLVPKDGRVVELPPGSYRVVASRGPEWSIASRAIEVEARAERDLALVLARERSIAGYVPCDLHLHSEGSPDSRVSFGDRWLSIAAEGVEVAVVSEHNRVVDVDEEAGALGLVSIPGVEVTTWEPSFGHFNVFPVRFDATLANGGAPAHSGTNPAELFRAAHALGPDTVVQVNHPRLDDAIGFFNAFPPDDPERGVLGFDAIEVWNGYELERPFDVERNFHEWLGLVARGVRVTATGSSDSHDLAEHIAGYPRTYVRTSDRGGAEIAQAILRGAAFVTSGPLLDVAIGDARPGDDLRVGGVVTLSVGVDAPEYARELTLEIYLGRARVYEEALPMLRGRAERTIDLEVFEPAPLVVKVSGAITRSDLVPGHVYPAAFTNPIWLSPG
jgi:hypothetical protein